MKQIKDTFNFDRRASLMYGDRMGQQHFLWTETLASDAGMHFHLWVPEFGAQYEKDYKESFKTATRRERDAVSFSWDYIPKGTCEEVYADSFDNIPDGAIASMRVGPGPTAKIIVILKPRNRESECPA
jgi:hypothetical protein